jgi:hypothetical protein
MIDFDPWHHLLQRYVNDQGRVNYRQWQQDDFETLSAWLRSLHPQALPAEPSAELQLALWINVYNAVTIYRILQRYPLKSVRPEIFGVPNWLAFLSFFNAPIFEWSANGKPQRLSLNQIEHEILRQRFNEPRIHFALVCASVGCPLLRNQAYECDRVRHQLEEDAVRFINNVDKVRYDAASQTLYCSKIFKWYKDDFLVVAPSVPAYVGQYLKSDSPKPSQTCEVQYLPYSWSLNAQTPASL